MPTRAHQAIAALLALWMPFCCCQVRAAAHAVAHVAAGDRGSAAHGAHGCCDGAPRTAACCDAASDGNDGGCCDPDQGGTSDRTPGADCCTSCKERTPPPPAPSIDHADAIGVDLPPTVGQPGPAPAAEGHERTAAHGHDTGPPPRPAGREALALHSILLD